MIKSALDESRRVRHSPLVQRHAAGSLFFLLVILLIGTLLYSTLSWMWDDQRLPLSKIVLQGDMEYVTTLDVQQSFAKLDHIGTFMSQDIESLQKTVQSIPWVSQVSIRKQWPDTVKIYLTEHQAEAIWNGDTLLNAKGKVFNGDIGELVGDRVKLYGPSDSSQHVLTIWREISPLFQALDLNIRSLVLNERRAWQIILDNGMRLELGKESLDERIARFVSLYENLGSDAERVSYIDLRYDTGAAVGWFPEPDLEQESTDD
ncbi:cell division protein FtsQ/DivIB [uncultured Vibrio sp.]|uniref:cell division protein FtsQ/DivIB n=1 Tax=uncultured Vibrio sp. TaxID=114054 RepID=UPI00091237F9|nr:cell division protein FtsQ/DivIB [uncultured Vibrio sp.]OIQ23695.1 MAG: cell division protein FtsQ [Vibrio sp. MedPE-SWchi]